MSNPRRRQRGRYTEAALRRRQPRRPRKQRPLVLFSCEGKETEARYVVALCKDIGLAPPDFAAKGADPWRVVEAAIADKCDGDYDAIWCLFDCDEHERLADARQRARDCEIDVACSNPCFELWYLLHFRYSTAYIHRDGAVAECARAMGGYHKAADVYEQLRPMQEAALENARRLRQEHHAQVDEGRPENPATDVDLMIIALRALSAS